MALARSLKKINIPFVFWPKYSIFGHIYGVFPKLNFIPGAPYVMDRFQMTAQLILDAITAYPNEFKDKELDIWIQLTDGPLQILDFVNALNLRCAFSYSTSFSFNDKVIAIVDFNTCYDEAKYLFKDRLPSKCKKVAVENWQDNRIFWRGNSSLSFSRRCLFELGKKYPQYLKIEDSSEGKFVPMFEQAKYKYLIDTRGFSWSGRLQTLLRLGRVVFIADRPFREWYLIVLSR